MDDARYVLTLVRTAASYGAQVASRVQVTGFLREGERVTGVQRRGPRDRRRAGDPRPAGRQRDRGVDRRDPGDGRRPGHDQRARLQGRPPGRAARTGSTRRPGSSCAPRSASCSSSRGDGTGSSAPPIPTGRAQGPPGGQPDRHRLPARPGSTGSWPPADPGGRRRASTPGCGRCWPASPIHLPAVPRARGRPPGARAGAGRGRQVHHLPGDGPGRGGCGGAWRWTGASPPSCTDRVPLAGADGYLALWNSRYAAGHARRACTWPGSSTCCAGTARWPARCSP